MLDISFSCLHASIIIIHSQSLLMKYPHGASLKINGVHTGYRFLHYMVALAMFGNSWPLYRDPLGIHNNSKVKRDCLDVHEIKAIDHGFNIPELLHSLCDFEQFQSPHKKIFSCTPVGSCENQPWKAEDLTIFSSYHQMTFFSTLDHWLLLAYLPAASAPIYEISKCN